MGPINSQNDLSIPNEVGSIAESVENVTSKVADSVAKNTRFESGKTLVENMSKPAQDLPEELLKTIPSDEQWAILRESDISDLTETGMTREQAKEFLDAFGFC